MHDASFAEHLKRLKTLTEKIDAAEYNAGVYLKDGKIDEDTYNEAIHVLSESHDVYMESIDKLEKIANDPRIQLSSC